MEAACAPLKGGSMPSGLRTLNVCGERGKQMRHVGVVEEDGNKRF
jgi:hypothetical protein